MPNVLEISNLSENTWIRLRPPRYPYPSMLSRKYSNHGFWLVRGNTVTPDVPDSISVYIDCTTITGRAGQHVFSKSAKAVQVYSWMKLRRFAIFCPYTRCKEF